MYSLLTKNQDINDPEYFRCCCGCHVKKGALIIASISIFGSVLQLFSGNIGSILSGIVGICAGVLVFCADNKERAWAYIPYLVLQALGIIGCLVAIFIFLAGVIVSPQWLFDTLNEKEFLTHDLGIWTLHEFRTFCFITIIILIINEVMLIWFWFIVFRAYRYRREVLDGPFLGDRVRRTKLNRTVEPNR